LSRLAGCLTESGRDGHSLGGVSSNLVRQGHSLGGVSPHLAYSLASGLGVDWTELAQNERADRPVWIQVSERP